jgi:hypothetical protein
MISIDINIGISINAKGGDCWIMLSLMSNDLFQMINVKELMSKGLID